MSGGTAEREEGFGYYNFGGYLIYFDKTPTEEEVLKKLAEIEFASNNAPHIDCGGACCADQSRIIKWPNFWQYKSRGMSLWQ